MLLQCEWGLRPLIYHTGQEELGMNQMTHPETEFKNRAPVPDQARHLSVLEPPHSSEKNETSSIFVALRGGKLYK